MVGTPRPLAPDMAVGRWVGIRSISPREEIRDADGDVVGVVIETQRVEHDRRADEKLVLIDTATRGETLLSHAQTRVLDDGTTVSCPVDALNPVRCQGCGTLSVGNPARCPGCCAVEPGVGDVVDLLGDGGERVRAVVAAEGPAHDGYVRVEFLQDGEASFAVEGGTHTLQTKSLRVVAQAFRPASEVGSDDAVNDGGAA